MLNQTAPEIAMSKAPRLRMAETTQPGWADDAAMTTLRDWVESYLMKGHPDLGRTGAVCPFTKQSAKLDMIRLAVSRCTADDEDEAFALIRTCFRELEQIECRSGMEHFRTIVVGFPDSADPAGIEMLERVQRRHKYYSLSRFRMIGFMHDGSTAEGLWNGAFRPLRSPMPVLAIRHLVEQDAPFAARHPLLMVPYVVRFRFGGVKRLIEYARRP